MYNYVAEMCTCEHISIAKWCIVVFCLMYCGICEMGLLMWRCMQLLKLLMQRHWKHIINWTAQINKVSLMMPWCCIHASATQGVTINGYIFYSFGVDAGIFQENWVNAMIADSLATQVVRASEVMILAIVWDRWIFVFPWLMRKVFIHQR